MRRLLLVAACGLAACHAGNGEPVDQASTNHPVDLAGVDFTGLDLAGVDFAAPPKPDMAQPPGNCLGESLVTGLGSDHLLLGGTMETTTATMAPFDVRYIYLSSGFPDGSGPCNSCLASCAVDGDECCSSNDGTCSKPLGCAWWGCWQYDQDPPGGYVRGFIDDNKQNMYQGKARPLLPMITYYEELQASKSQAIEGPKQLAALENQTFLTRYFADWRFLLQQVGDDVALLHVEPDMWGYVEQASVQGLPATKPPVATANPTDCAGQPSTMTGFAQCLIAMTRKYAPNAKIGLHASPWGTNMDAVGNGNPGLDVAAEAQKLADFLMDLGAGDGDYLVADVSDRDAGWDMMNGDDTWWDKTNKTIPNFTQAFAWSKALAERANMPVLWWQIPVGNEALDDTYQKYRDNRVDYLMTHLGEVASAHVVGLFFGGGLPENTTIETDGGNLIAKVKANSHSVCP